MSFKSRRRLRAPVSSCTDCAGSANHPRLAARTAYSANRQGAGRRDLHPPSPPPPSILPMLPTPMPGSWANTVAFKTTVPSETVGCRSGRRRQLLTRCWHRSPRAATAPGWQPRTRCRELSPTTLAENGPAGIVRYAERSVQSCRRRVALNDGVGFHNFVDSPRLGCASAIRPVKNNSVQEAGKATNNGI